MKSMDKNDFSNFDLALKNGDIAMTDQIVKKYGLQDQMKNIRNMLNDIHKRAKEVGIDVGYVENYWPRTIADPKGFVEYMRGQDDWSIIQEALDKKEMEIGRYLTEEEKAAAINSLLRGYSVSEIRLERPANLKERKVDFVTPEMNSFYDTSNNSLIRYVEAVNNQIEAKRFFGGHPEASAVDKLFKLKDYKYVNIDDSIGAYTLKLLAEGKISPAQESEIREILTARFNARGAHGIVAAYRNLEYIDTMGSPISAITQFGDLAWSLYKSGFYKTSGAFLKSLTGKSKITKKDIGIDNIAQEFNDSSKTASYVAKVFKMTGLNRFDALGKETLINSAYSRLQQEALKKNNRKFINEIRAVFGDEADQVITDLKNGVASENVKYLLFSELLDFQPVALSEMPEKYLTGGNGRIFYMLKSFTLKQIDVSRREAFDKIAEGNVKEGLGNLIRFAVAFMLMNGTADVIKDFLLNREIDLNDLLLDNLLRLAGFSKFQIYKAREEGIGSTALRTIVPPAKFIDSLWKDIRSIKGAVFDGKQFNLKDIETVQSIPIAGKLYYWWFGKGREKSNKKKSKKIRD